jgi:hypothetical protein
MSLVPTSRFAMFGNRQFLQRHGGETHVAPHLAGAVAEILAQLAFRRAAHMADGVDP